MSDAADPSAEATEATKTDEQLRAILGRKTGFVGAIAQGTKLAARTASTGLPLVLMYALVGGLGGYFCIGLADAAKALEPDQLELAKQIGMGISAFLILYSVVQFTKRSTASRASWAPSLLAAPAVMFTGALFLISGGQAAQLGPVVISLFLMPWNLAWASIGGAATAVGWVRAGHETLEGRAVSLPEVFSEVGARTLEVAGPHGARVHAVTIGMQILVPGIFYALQLAFTDMVAVLEPDRAALKRSGALTWGMRGRLFRLLLTWFVVSQLLGFGVAVLLMGSTEPVVASFFDPGQLSLVTFVVVEATWALTAWVLELALLVLYVEREGQVAAKRELRRRKREANRYDGAESPATAPAT